jgi:hypothetical protein
MWRGIAAGRIAVKVFHIQFGLQIECETPTTLMGSAGIKIFRDSYAGRNALMQD